MRTNLFNIEETYKKLKELGGIKEIGNFRNLKDNCFETQFEVGKDMLSIRQFPRGYMDIKCNCKHHMYKNAKHPEAWCEKKSILVLFLTEEHSREVLE